MRAAGAGGAVACVACPSVFKALRTSFPRLRAQLLEYDARFQALGCFSQYDYREPHAVGPELHGAFDVVVADPPYLVRASASHPQTGSERSRKGTWLCISALDLHGACCIEAAHLPCLVRPLGSSFVSGWFDRKPSTCK